MGTNNTNNTNNPNVNGLNQEFRSETDPAEGSATGNLRDLGVLCGEKNTCPPDTELSTGRGVVFFPQTTQRSRRR